MAQIKVAVINASTVVSDDDVSSAVPALQKQVSRDLAPVWGVDADLTFVPKGTNPAAGSWWLTIQDDSDTAGALGYHDITPEGLPLGKVFAKTDQLYGNAWTVTTSHELLEMLIDPDINLTVFVQSSETAGTLYAYEVCDACEADELGYKIDNVLVSDFVYPAWFESFRKGSSQFDYQDQIRKPFDLLRGGYIGIFDVTAGGGWQQKTAAKGKMMLYESRAKVGSRRERRRTPREQWQKSIFDPSLFADMKEINALKKMARVAPASKGAK